MEASSSAISASACGVLEVIVEDDRDPAAQGLISIKAGQMRRMAIVSEDMTSCAVQRHRTPAGGRPAWQLSFQPVVIGAVDGGNDMD